MKLIIFKIHFIALKTLGLQSLHLVEIETKRVQIGISSKRSQSSQPRNMTYLQRK